MNIQPMHFILLVLITWRISNLFANENGPAHFFKRLRIYVRALCIFGPKFFCWFHCYELLNCEYCNSVWFGTGIALIFTRNIFTAFPLALALSASVIFLKHIKQAIEHIEAI